MWRTQHGTSAVSPSQGLLTGFRYTANRVSPWGKRSSGPSEIQLFADSRLKLDNTKPRRGTPIRTAAMPFNPAPTFRRRLRRDIGRVDAPLVAASFWQPQSDF